ncbi:hypothetical protein CEV32_3269 [Brucella rhizosphaerae]|uniref:Uncharacterized protein n=1 Tax=Brucella rhizosphaerae TaxID=571254 RepID=A0A256FUA8_9HYPH|nr:hypothetical protein CEV32_3269 [Brucella rhizosphaerae]
MNTDDQQAGQQTVRNHEQRHGNKFLHAFAPKPYGKWNIAAATQGAHSQKLEVKKIPS